MYFPDNLEVAEHYRAQATGLEPVLDIKPLLQYACRPAAVPAQDLNRPNEDEPLESPRVISFLRRLRRRFLQLFLQIEATPEHLDTLREEEEIFTHMPFGRYSSDRLSLFDFDELEYMP